MDFLSGPSFGSPVGAPKSRDQVLEASEVKFGTMAYLYSQILSFKVKFPSGKKLWAPRPKIGPLKLQTKFFKPTTMKFVCVTNLIEKDISYSDFKNIPTYTMA